MRNCKKLQFEYELEAQIIYQFQKEGARQVAYEPIVGSGANACILHYVANDKPLAPNSLVLIDAGCEYQNYASDITRTFPVSGSFSSAQKDIYELVLKSQRAAIKTLKPGMPFAQAQKIIVDVLVEGLLDLEIIRGTKAQLIADRAYQNFYMHNSGHWLGLDVHDCGAYKEADNKSSRILKPGMVLTIEPGLYFAAHLVDIAPKWHNIGVRIEDDILITDSGCENLTQDLVVSITDIEAKMRD